MGKVIRSFTLDAELSKALDSESRGNYSETVNQLLREAIAQRKIVRFQTAQGLAYAGLGTSILILVLLLSLLIG